MDSQLDNLDLLDLFSAKYFKLRKINEQMWNNSYNIPITNSEWFILSLIYGNQPTISEIAQLINISRQAAHKSIKLLSSKDLIVINKVENNNRNKCLTLTPLGEKCFIENKLMKETLERDVVAKIGSENAILLKNLLKAEWI